MKPNPPATRNKLPKARAGYTDFQLRASPSFADIHRVKAHAADDDAYGVPSEVTPTVLIPCLTAKAAKLRVKVENLSHEERIKCVESVLAEANYKAFRRHDLGAQITDTVEQTRDYANRILTALGYEVGFETEGEKP